MDLKLDTPLPMDNTMDTVPLSDSSPTGVSVSVVYPTWGDTQGKGHSHVTLPKVASCRGYFQAAHPSPQTVDTYLSVWLEKTLLFPLSAPQSTSTAIFHVTKYLY